jgi:hypothetical protein
MNKKVSELVSGGMGAAAFFTITQLITRDALDCFLQIAVTLFAVIIPILVYLWIDPLVIRRETRNGRLKDIVDSVLFVGTNLAAWVGFVMLFWHFGLLPGIFFSVMAGLLTLYIAWLAFWFRSPDSRRGSEIAD